ncbi:MAG: DUF1028 domain-containing protein [Mangrovicoccus sp.]
MTFSIVARCAQTGMFGTAISSSSPAVAARCSYAWSGVGAVSTQNVTDPRLGPMALDLMAQGKSAQEALAEIAASQPHMAYRQVLAVDNTGESAIFSGPNALGIWSEAKVDHAAAAGNLLAAPDVPEAILEGFAASSGHLGDRLLAALKAGLAAGGEAGPVHSAGLLLVDQVAWPVADLRCDWHEACPIEALAEAWAVYKPQLQDYVQRALDPRAAPSYGVPGDA